ncbi:MAG: LIC_10190 family membrane protein [Rubripirellula sp.]
MLPLVGIIGVLCTWCFLAAVFLGCGLTILRSLGLRPKNESQPFLSFWIGWAGCIVLLQLWHLRYPVNDWILLAVTLWGVIGLTLERKTLAAELKTWWAGTSRKSLWVTTIAGSVVLVFWAALAIGPPYRPDTANYHLAGVRWASQYPIIPGLGNLHHRLAFNNSSFLYAAMLDAGPWTHRSHHLAHGLLAVVTVLYFMSRIPRLADKSAANYPLYLMQALFFPIAILFSYKGTTSFQPDLITFMLGLVVASLLFELLLDKQLSMEQIRLRVFAVCFLSSAALTVKLSFLVFGFLSSCTALVILWRASREPRRSYAGLVAICSVAAVISIVPWVGRHLILSGYALYPSHRVFVDVPWRVPLADAQLAGDSIVGYARHHGEGFMETLDNFDWVGPVILRELGHPLSVTIPLICVLSTLVGLAFVKRPKSGSGLSNLTLVVFLVPATCAVLFMVFTAPCPRFAGASIWVLAVGLMVGSLSQLDRTSLLFKRNSQLMVALGIGLFAIGIVKASRYVQSPFGNSVLAPMPEGEVFVMSTKSGLPVHVGKDGSWDAPLPNTPEFRPNLALVNEHDVRDGFMILSDEEVASRVASRRADSGHR